jgi:hypothetical protein|tara:strand:+ start:480 stop:689 length:210 start_codon:yes stop_codon:yes gene_type:complete
MDEPENYFHDDLKKNLWSFFDKRSQLMGRAMPKKSFPEARSLPPIWKSNYFSAQIFLAKQFSEAGTIEY